MCVPGVERPLRGLVLHTRSRRSGGDARCIKTTVIRENGSFDRVRDVYRDVYEGATRLRMPPVIRSYTGAGVQKVTLGEVQ